MSLPKQDPIDYKKNAQEIESDLVTPDHYYIDLGLVKDYWLGALFYLIHQRSPHQAQKDYLYMRSQMKPYQMRYFDHVESCFPDLHITTQEVLDLLGQESAHDRIFQLSPTTNFIETLKTVIAMNVNHSLVKEKFQKERIDLDKYYKVWDSVTFHLNTYPLKIQSPTLIRLIQQFFADNFRVDVVVFSQDPQTLEKSLIILIEEFYCRCFDRFMDNPAVIPMMEAQSFQKKRLFALGIFHHTHIHKTPREFEYEYRMIQARLDLMCRDFNWLNQAQVAVDLSVFKPSEEED